MALNHDQEIDGLISGPPCPPVSSIGQRKVDKDARTTVFMKVLDWIEFLPKRANIFVWFIVENPLGIEKRKQGHESSMGDAVMLDLFLLMLFFLMHKQHSLR